MKIIGYNSSHETSLCQFDTDTWEIDFLYEEERFRRVKQWTPEPPQHQLLCIERKQIQTPDHYIGCSFDRREFQAGRGLDFNMDLLKFNKKFNRELLSFIEKEQMTLDRFKEFHDKYPDVFKRFDLESIQRPNETDDLLHSTVGEQLGVEEFIYEYEHHLYHAECGYWFSPWREKEKAIALVCDGGGSKLYHDKGFPNYQEVETVYLCQPDTVPEKQWQRMSNYRYMDDWGSHLFWEESRERATAAPDLVKDMDGVETVFSSKPSMGQIFSALSLYFGFDRLGRAAGKVMGAASYQKWYEQDTYFDMTTYSIGNQLQQRSFEHTCAILQRAVDKNPDVKNIILSGGYALNCTNNAKYLERFPDHQFFVDPVAHDGGTAVGGAIRLARALKHGVEI